MGERNNPILPTMAIAALEQLIEWQPERIGQFIQTLTDIIEVAAEERGMLVPPRQHRVAHLLVFDGRGVWAPMISRKGLLQWRFMSVNEAMRCE
ncbi:MAG: hypothetical protein CM1200mP18_07990 [Gammaproteobacteria bacterium]|nr:MAG: hypothetical protein CM1200mP18_07990 [Gammaproteobacteria bacterium]